MDRAKLPLHKREELRKKEDMEATKEVYKEFLASFEEEDVGAKTFVRGEVVQHGPQGARQHDPPSSGGSRLYKPPQMYKPPPSSIASQQHSDPMSAARRLAEEKARAIMQQAAKEHGNSVVPKVSAPKPPTRSRMSNLEAFKEELRQMQEARDERRKVRKQLRDQLGADADSIDRIAPSLDNPYAAGSYDHDPYTTNLFMSNLSPELTIEDVYSTFGSFGPLASAKIMWPRTEEESLRGYNCGFVAFMTRVDADRAVAALRGRLVRGHEMKMSFAKPVAIPLHPVYVPPAMMELTVPPPPSGLPFNAQPKPEDQRDFHGVLPKPGQPPPCDTPEDIEAWNKMIRNAVVRVVIPTERPLLALIHRTIEFVVREGPVFEALLMSREMNNMMFRFLFDNQCPAHVYYRWRLYSILQGDQPNKWREEDFRMFEDGSIWRPPPVNFYAAGMPKELYAPLMRGTSAERSPRSRSGSPRSRSPRSRSRSRSPRSRSGSRSRSRSRSPPTRFPTAAAVKTLPGYGVLSDRRRDVLEDLLRKLTPERDSISAAMIFCVENADCSNEIVECIIESLSILETPLHKKIARLYLVSDILGNCAAKVANMTFYRKFFGEHLEKIFTEIGKAYSAIEGRLKAEQFKQRVMYCFRAWEDQAVYPTDFLIKLQNLFLGLVMESLSSGEGKPEEAEEDIDGTPMDAQRPMSGALAQLVDDYDIDGAPIDEEPAVEEHRVEESSSSRHRRSESPPEPQPPQTTPKQKDKADKKGGFVKSKWEEIDQETVEKQAVTSSKWDEVEEGGGEERVDRRRSNKTKSTSGLGLVEYGTDDGDTEEDLDGVPMDDDDTSQQSSSSISQSRTSSDRAGGDRSNRHSHNRQQQQLSEERRQALREIEVKVMKYQDELETGRRSVPHGSNIAATVADFRRGLLEKLDHTNSKSNSPDKHSRRSSKKNRDKDKERSSRRSRSRSKGRKRSKSRSRSPKHRKRSRR